MPLSLIRRELRGAFVYFIPEGAMVDGGAVTSTAWPDNNPLTNYTEWQFADIASVADFREENTETFMVASTQGGYDQDEERTLMRRGWECTSAKTNSILKQLEHGLASPVAAGVPQTPMAKRDNYLDGVLLIEIKGKDGSVIERTQVWARLRITKPPETSEKTATISFRFEQLPSALNTYQAS